MRRKTIALSTYAALREEAKRRSAGARGCRQRAKKEEETLRSLIASTPGIDYVDAEYADYALVLRTKNLGSKTYPDTYKAVDVWPLDQCKVTEKRITWGSGRGSEYVNGESVICFCRIDQIKQVRGNGIIESIAGRILEEG